MKIITKDERDNFVWVALEDEDGLLHDYLDLSRTGGSIVSVGYLHCKLELQGLSDLLKKAGYID